MKATMQTAPAPAGPCRSRPRFVTPPFLTRLLAVRHPRARLSPEDREGIDLATRLRAWSLDGKLRAVWCHVPNELGGKSRTAEIRYAVAKALGLIPGAADYLFLTATGGYAIELKAPRGRQSDTQRDFQAWCDLNGVPYTVCKGADAAEAQLRAWGVVA